MAGSKDRITQSPEWVAERNSLVPPVRQLLQLSAQRRSERDQIADTQRHEMALVAQKYPQHESQIVAMYSKIYGVHMSIANGNTIVGGLVTEGLQDVFQSVKDKDAKMLLSFYYASNVLHRVHENQGNTSFEGTYAMRQEEIRNIVQALGLPSLQAKGITKVTLGTVIEKVMQGEI